MDDTDSGFAQPEPAHLRLLRRLVTALTLTLTLGMIVIVGLLVWRLGPGRPAPLLPQDIPLPAGERLTGLSTSPQWTVLITTDADGTQRVHVVARGAGTIHQSVTLRPVAAQ